MLCLLTWNAIDSDIKEASWQRHGSLGSRVLGRRGLLKKAGLVGSFRAPSFETYHACAQGLHYARSARESATSPLKMSSIRSSRKVSVDYRDAERLGDLFYNRQPTEDQLECLLTLLANYDKSAIPSLVNSPITKYANQTSMHLAAKGGLYHCLEILLIHGGKFNNYRCVDAFYH